MIDSEWSTKVLWFWLGVTFLATNLRAYIGRSPGYDLFVAVFAFKVVKASELFFREADFGVM